MSEQPQFGRREISKEMRTSFLDYAMSVIVSRALPDVRDGLKPVHRRILYGMNELGVTPDKPYKKSARIVGDVMGKYHPHGDAAIYESMVRMAQDFSYRYMLVDGHGNFGSVDGDQAAAMRYTEARLSKISLEMVRDINKQTVDFIPNYDGEEKEPEVLPSRFPNLLVNGATGIAVGMTTNIPPHNLSEVISAIHLLMKNPEVETAELMKVLPGPDFPTGGIVVGKSGIKRAYDTGKGKITLRARVVIEPMSNGKERIRITELPYMVNKARLVERIAELARDKRIDGITAVRDETGRDGMRIIIEVRKDANASVILNNLYKETQLQTSFNFNMVAIVNGVPKTLSLKEILYHYLNHQEEVIRRRSIFEKEKAERRAHILEGLQIALDHIDAIVEILRTSRTGDQAKDRFMNEYGLSDRQSQAILDMRMVRLTGLERDKIDSEYRSLQEQIAYLNEVLSSEEKRYEIIYEELLEIQDRFGDERRTTLQIGEITDIEDEDLIDERPVFIALTRKGYIKRMDETEFRTQNRGGRGVKGMDVQEGDALQTLLSTSTHNLLLFFTNKGRVYQLKGYEIPEYSRIAKGLPVVNLLQLDEDEKVRAMIKVDPERIKKPDEHNALLFVTKNGTVKRTPSSEYFNIRNNGLIAIKLNDEDELVTVLETSGDDKIILATRHGQAASFKESDVRLMGRSAAGVIGIRLTTGDDVIAAALLHDDSVVVTVSEKGYGKKTPAEEFSIKHRGTKGILAFRETEKTGELAGLTTLNQTGEDVLLMTEDGTVIRFHAEDVSLMSRATQGVRLMRLDEGTVVSSLAIVSREDDDEDDTSEEEYQDNLSENMQAFAQELIEENSDEEDND